MAGFGTGVGALRIIERGAAQWARQVQQLSAAIKWQVLVDG
jgi:hypothetical protein